MEAAAEGELPVAEEPAVDSVGVGVRRALVRTVVMLEYPASKRKGWMHTSAIGGGGAI